jgi:hypothetical protein
MALNTGADPCSLLNSNEYPTLWLTKSFELEFSNIFQTGTLKTYSSVLTAANKEKPIITGVLGETSRLATFLNGKTIQMINNSKPIVDVYIMSSSGLSKSSYAYSTTEAPTVTDNNIKTIVDKLITDGLLLAQDELFKESQFNGGEVAPNTDSLVYLYSIQENANKALTNSQITRKVLLEERNPRFFSNFLMEYCFYKTRYNILLTKYFDLYILPLSTTIPNDQNIFGGGVSPTSTSGGAAAYSQQDYLKGLAYHMACLNTRMTDMRRVLGEITSRYNIIFQFIQTAINNGSIPGSNVELTSTIQALNNSAKDVNTYMSEADFKKGVMDYNSEKNRYANIMLALYAFLNIAGIASIYHLASSS